MERESVLVAQFMEITGCESKAAAVRQLSSCRWNLDEAMDRFFAAGGVVADPSDAASSPPVEEEVRAPTPSGVEEFNEEDHDDMEQDDDRSVEGDDGMDSYEEDSLQTDDEDDEYDHDSMLEEEQEQRRPPQEQRPRHPRSLSQMYRPPYELIFNGSFHDAKVHAARQDQFVLVNLQAIGQTNFSSMLLNRDLWADSMVRQVVRDNFVFQLHRNTGDYYKDEGTKVCSFYKVQDNELPTVLVVDPVTGQMLGRLSGAIQPADFMLFIDRYTKLKPSDISRPKIGSSPVAVPGCSEAASAGIEQETARFKSSASLGAGGEREEVEPVPVVDAEMVDPDGDEPMEGEEMYKLRVRFPNGSVGVSKEFGCKQRVSKLFEFCGSALRDAGNTQQVAFRIMRLVGRSLEELHNDGATFEDLGLNLASVSVTFVS